MKRGSGSSHAPPINPHPHTPHCRTGATSLFSGHVHRPRREKPRGKGLGMSLSVEIRVSLAQRTMGAMPKCALPVRATAKAKRGTRK